MIGPSETAGKATESQCCLSSKRKIFDELDIDSYCEEIPQTNHKRCLQELNKPVELATSNEILSNATALFSPMSGQEVVEETPVTRLEVLLVDGTNCTWTTVSELEQQNLDVLVTSSSSSLSSSSITSSGCADQYATETYIVEETKQSPKNYWDPVTAPALLLTNSNGQQYKNYTANNYQQQQQQQFEDQENGNLSWLLDFKLDSFIEAADRPTGSVMTKDNYCGNRNKPNGRLNGSSGGREIRKGHGSHDNSSMYRHNASQAAYPTNEINTGNLSSSRSNGLKKPPFTYTELIEHALQEKGELTVSAIYQWISEHFPYYKSNDDRWKNSVRHNLSINPHFRKGSKAPHGAGHLWAIANRGEFRPRPLDVLAAGHLAQNARDGSRGAENAVCESAAEVEIATASIAQPNYEDGVTNGIPDDVAAVTLEDSAEQILNGVKREVEVQYLVPMGVADADHEMTQQDQQIAQPTELQCLFKETDFLHTVSKEDVAVECGLSEEYVVTDPNALGLNLVDPDIIEPESLFGEELSFQFYELTSPSSQLQSA